MSHYETASRLNRRQAPNRSKRASSTENDHFDQLPIETGKIHTLLEHFGFIYCADRASDLFFHYSEVRGCSVADLNLGDEVQFHVGPSSKRSGSHSNRDRLDEEEEHQAQKAAFRVKVLPPGTVQWEIEEEPKGVRRKGRVEKMIRFHSHGGRDVNPTGTIRLEALDMESVEGDLELKSQKSVLVRFTPNDYQGYSDHSSKKGIGDGSGSSKTELETGDLVEFTLVTEKRSRLQYARNITLLQSERQRIEEEREKKLLERATREQGVVVSLKNGFGFLKSNKRREEVYFHYSNIELPDNDQEEEHALKEGQEMEFLVVEDANKISARQLVFLPKGSVVFEIQLAKNVIGKLNLMPNMSTSSRRSNKDLEAPGKIELKEVISVENDGNIETIREVDVYPDDIQHLIREEVWIRPGDTLLFDVVKSLVDERCRAVPTKTQETTARIRLIKPCLAGRAEGVVVSLKDNFGFIQLAQRKLDVYFRIADVFPVRIQKDMWDDSEGKHQLTDDVKVGNEVSFDLSLVLSEPGNGGRGRNSKRGGGADKETSRAQRVLILPPGSIASDKIYPSTTGSIVKVEHFNKFCGTVKLDQKLMGMTILERNPLLERLFDEFEAENAIVLHFNDVQSEFENDTIVQAAAERSGLEVVFTPVAEFGKSSRGRISLRKKSNSLSIPENEIDDDVVEMDDEKDPSVNSAIFEVKEDEKDQNEVMEVCQERDASNMMAEDQTTGKFSFKNRKKRSRAIQALSYDKTSISSSLLNDPPQSGDKVQMDITYSRSSGKFILSNLDVIERCSDKSNTIKYNLCEGYILLEPRHSSLLTSSRGNKKKGFKGGDEERWGTTVNDNESTNDNNGLILLIKDPGNLFRSKKTNTKHPINDSKDESSQVKNEISTEILRDGSHLDFHWIPYTLACVGGRNGVALKRGDLVSFVRGKNGNARDVQLLETGIALRIKGRLVNLDVVTEIATFISDDDKSVNVRFSDIVGCDAQTLKDGVAVEGIEIGDFITGSKSLCDITIV